jgi:hypothetical protein
MLRLKVTSKWLKHKEHSCAFEDLSLRCGANKNKLADLRSSGQHAHLCNLMRGSSCQKLANFLYCVVG